MTMAWHSRVVCAARLLPLLLLLTVSTVVQAQYTYTADHDQMTITRYDCSSGSGAITIPSTINGLPVTSFGNEAFSFCTNLSSITIPHSVISIGNSAFEGCTSLTNVTIPDSVTSIGSWAFSFCTSLTRVTIPNGLTSIRSGTFSRCTTLASVTIPESVTSIQGQVVPGIGGGAFSYCTSLTNVTIPNSVTNIGDFAFSYCTGLTSVTIPDSVISIGGLVFRDCTRLTEVYFKGNAPMFDAGGYPVFGGADNATLYYLPGTTGWGSTFDGRPTAQWVLPTPLILNNGPSFGMQNNGLGFIISWATNISVVVEASPDLSNPTWSTVSTNTLTDGSSRFTDPQSMNYLSRFYRLRSP
jgi:hypothetical protein